MPPFIAFSTHETSKQWNYELNGDIKPENVGRGSKLKYWFNCLNEKCGHVFEKQVYSLVFGGGCPYCCNFSSKLCDDEDCDWCWKRSFASSKYVDRWSSSNTLTPRQVIKTSTAYHWFYCKVCEHDFQAILRNVSIGKFCAFCYGVQLCSEKHCDWCKKNSFESSDKAKYWSKKNIGVTPRDVFRGKQEKFWFDCPCGHEVLLSLEGIYKGYWCHFCCNKSTKLCKNPDCVMCFEKSFASRPESKFLSPENTFNPRDVYAGSMTKAKFICDKNPKHKFEMKLFSVYYGHWCHFCTRKMEAKLWEVLSDYYVVKKQPKFEWCRGKKGIMLPYDFVIKGTNIIIELDGGQHFVQVKNWQTPEYTQNNDWFKMNKAFENGYCVIRITWDLVHKRKELWIDKLVKYINDLVEIKAEAMGAFICEKNEYKAYY